jgi:hypothetical protein
MASGCPAAGANPKKNPGNNELPGFFYEAENYLWL